MLRVYATGGAYLYGYCAVDEVTGEEPKLSTTKHHVHVLGATCISRDGW